MKRTESVRKTFLGMTFTSEKGDMFNDSRLSEPRRKVDSYGMCTASLAGLWTPITRNRRDDTPPTAAVIA